MITGEIVLKSRVFTNCHEKGARSDARDERGQQSGDPKQE